MKVRNSPQKNGKPQVPLRGSLTTFIHMNNYVYVSVKVFIRRNKDIQMSAHITLITKREKLLNTPVILIQDYQ